MYPLCTPIFENHCLKRSKTCIFSLADSVYATLPFPALQKTTDYKFAIFLLVLFIGVFYLNAANSRWCQTEAINAK